MLWRDVSWRLFNAALDRREVDLVVSSVTNLANLMEPVTGD
jgi:hypothetical protein